MKPAPIGDCDVAVFGICNATRIRTDEYALELPGLTASAIHVIDGLGKGEKPAQVSSLKGRGGNGVLVSRGGRVTAVVTSGCTVAGAAAPISYTVDGAEKASHVALDAPEDGSGRASVRASAAGGKCAVELQG